MRWKLVLVVSSIASLVGSGLALAIILFLAGSTPQTTSGPSDLVALSPLIIPVALIIVASIFVYRHTAKRRKLQAMMTALLSAILMLTVFFVGMVVFKNNEEPRPPTPQPTRIAESRLISLSTLPILRHDPV